MTAMSPLNSPFFSIVASIVYALRLDSRLMTKVTEIGGITLRDDKRGRSDNLRDVDQQVVTKGVVSGDQRSAVLRRSEADIWSESLAVMIRLVQTGHVHPPATVNASNLEPARANFEPFFASSGSYLDELCTKIKGNRICKTKVLLQFLFSSIFCRTCFDDSKHLWKKNRKFTWGSKLEPFSVSIEKILWQTLINTLFLAVSHGLNELYSAGRTKDRIGDSLKLGVKYEDDTGERWEARRWNLHDDVLSVA
jgi:hypothetical protein